MSSETLPWWRHGVVYQVYIRSFADSTGDGTGDINGLRSRLRYLAELGVDAVWINPWYKSPLADGGYDVADYRQIEARYGTLDEAEALIAEAHALGVKVIPDLVPNHTSEEHAWFQEALASPPGHPSRQRYHIVDGKGPDGSEPPSDWTSVFGGPAWTRLPDGQWYLHLFAPEQPDLNWTHPEVREEFKAILRFWLDRGADGFRVDVAHGLTKDMSYPDLGERTDELLATTQFDGHPFWDRDELHEIVREWRAVLDSYEGDRMMVAEAWIRPERVHLYLRPDEYHQSFNFDLLETPWVAEDYRAAIQRSLESTAAVGSIPSSVLANHDVMRETTRLGLPPGTNWRRWLLEGPHDLLDAEAGWRRARAAALIQLSLPGSTYLYQGQELGLPEVWDLPPEVLDDPVWKRSGGTAKGRDGCRVPVPWTVDGPSFGFGSGEPWLPQPADWGALSAAAQEGVAGSTHSLFRDALALRRKWCVDDEQLDILDLGPDLVGFRRGSGLRCLANMGSTSVPLPEHDQVLVRSGLNPDGTPVGPDAPLAPDEAVWLR